MIFIAVVLAVFVAGVTLTLFTKSNSSPHARDEEAWDRAKEGGNDLIYQITMAVGRPLSRLPALHEQGTSRLYRKIQDLLLASGGKYGSSPEVFLSATIGMSLLSFALVAVLLLVTMPTIVLFALVAIVLLLPAYPYNVVSKAASDRAEKITVGLPDFAELLQMPITSGMGIIEALRFTSDRQRGPVADEVHNMLNLIETQAMEDERMPFILAGARLGTPEAVAFLNALMSAYVDAIEVAKTIATQAETLRMSAYQAARARNKRLPVKLVIIFATCLLPLLFIVILIPTAIGISKI